MPCKLKSEDTSQSKRKHSYQSFWLVCILCSHDCLLYFSFLFVVFFAHSQCFFRGTPGQVLHIVSDLAADDTQATTAFLELPEDDFPAGSKIIEELPTRRKFATWPTSNASKEQPLLYPDVAHKYSTPNAWPPWTSYSPPMLCPIYYILCITTYFRPLLVHWGQVMIMSPVLHRELFLPRVCTASVSFSHPSLSYLTQTLWRFFLTSAWHWGFLLSTLSQRFRL